MRELLLESFAFGDGGSNSKTGAIQPPKRRDWVAEEIRATLAVASLSTHIVWTSPSLPKLTSIDSPIGTTLTNEEASWVASAAVLGGLPGGMLAGWTAEKFGRRGSLLLSAVPMFAGWVVIVFAKSALVLTIARFVAGIGGGVAMTVTPMYIGEIAENDIRGRLGTILNILVISGKIFVLSIGPFLSYTALILSCSVIPVAFATLFYFMPESPYFLVKTGRTESARQNLLKLSPINREEKLIDSRLHEIVENVEHDMRNKSTLWELFSNQDYRRALIILIGLASLKQLSGVNAIDSYMQTIFELANTSLSPEISSIICGFIQLPAVLIASLLVDRMGRKPLLILSALGCAVALVGEGVYFYLQDVAKIDTTSISWLPASALIVYLTLTPIGVMTLLFVLTGELFPANVKSVAASVVMTYLAGMGFIVVRFFTPIATAWGMHTMFWMFAGVCVLGSVFVFCLLPETKGKAFPEIQEKLNKNKEKQQHALNTACV